MHSIVGLRLVDTFTRTTFSRFGNFKSFFLYKALKPKYEIIHPWSEALSRSQMQACTVKYEVSRKRIWQMKHQIITVLMMRLTMVVSTSVKMEKLRSNFVTDEINVCQGNIYFFLQQCILQADWRLYDTRKRLDKFERITVAGSRQSYGITQTAVERRAPLHDDMYRLDASWTWRISTDSTQRRQLTLYVDADVWRRT